MTLLHTSQLQVLAEMLAVEEAEGVNGAWLAEREAVEPEGDEDTARGEERAAWVEVDLPPPWPQNPISSNFWGVV